MASNPKVHLFEEVSKHNKTKDCWLIISGKVYDVTPSVDDHLGGDEVLLSATAKDVTTNFEDVGHSDSARELMAKYYIGEIDASNVPLKCNYVPPRQTESRTSRSPRRRGEAARQGCDESSVFRDEALKEKGSEGYKSKLVIEK
ncbi:Cytochrome b5 isoform E [Sarracenia purpurea var. burkii]